MRAAAVARLCLAGLISSITIAAAPPATYDNPNRQELKRVDLSGAPGMEVITSITEYKVGETIPRHVHHGVETGYVLQGSGIQVPGKAPARLETGAPILNLRDVPHAGFTVIGPEPLKLLTVHIVDKDKPLYDWVN
jgi:quercetin dioxygenase-like cupin family protein